MAHILVKKNSARAFMIISQFLIHSSPFRWPITRKGLRSGGGGAGRNRQLLLLLSLQITIMFSKVTKAQYLNKVSSLRCQIFPSTLTRYFWTVFIIQLYSFISTTFSCVLVTNLTPCILFTYLLFPKN